MNYLYIQRMPGSVVTQTTSKIILVGADPAKIGTQHPGGVQTLSAGIIEGATSRGFEVTVVDTTRSNFGETGIRQRIKSGLQRFKKLQNLMRESDIYGVIIISGAGYSFLERSLMAATARWHAVNTLFINVDGWFMAQVIKRWHWSFIARWLLKFPHHIAAMGDSWHQFYRDLGVADKKLVDINFFISEEFPVSDRPVAVSPKEPVHFVFVGWLVESKGVCELIEAASQLEANHDFKLTFLGGGTMLETVQEWAGKANRKDRFAAPGWVQGEQLQKMISQAHVFVLPSYAEGFPMSLIEAFSCGLPAIVSDVGGVSSSLVSGKNGYLVKPANVKSLAEAMVAYIRNPALVSEHGENALKTVKERHNRQANVGIILDALARNNLLAKQ